MFLHKNILKKINLEKIILNLNYLNKTIDIFNLSKMIKVLNDFSRYLCKSFSKNQKLRIKHVFFQSYRLTFYLTKD